MIDGISGDAKKDFAKRYSELYNSVNEKNHLASVKHFLSHSIDHSTLNDILKITPELIKEAISRLKNNKSDPVFDFTSNCRANLESLNAPLQSPLKKKKKLKK